MYIILFIGTFIVDASIFISVGNNNKLCKLFFSNGFAYHFHGDSQLIPGYKSIVIHVEDLESGLQVSLMILLAQTGT